MADESTITLSWDEYLADIDQLIKALVDRGVAATHCYGIPLDGLIPSVIIARRLGMDVTDGPRSVMHSYKGEHLVVVTGFSDRGEDFVTWRNQENIRTASVYLTDNKRPRIVPDVHSRVVPDGSTIVFPYDVGGAPRTPSPEEFGEKTVW